MRIDVVLNPRIVDGIDVVVPQNGTCLNGCAAVDDQRGVVVFIPHFGLVDDLVPGDGGVVEDRVRIREDGRTDFAVVVAERLTGIDGVIRHGAVDQMEDAFGRDRAPSGNAPGRTPGCPNVAVFIPDVVIRNIGHKEEELAAGNVAVSPYRVNGAPVAVEPELRGVPGDLAVVEAQKARLGTKRGFISVKSNCSIQSYVPALHPLKKFGIKNVLACTYQAISGAGKTFDTWPEMVDNLIPYIGGEEEKSEKEPLKVWGEMKDGKIVPAEAPSITTQCLRVPVSNGHFAAVFVSFENKPSKEEILQLWKEYKGVPQDLELPSAPKQFLNYFEEDNYPQAKLHRNLENGMAVSIGRLREDTQYDYKFVCLSHNTLRGAAGGAVEMAELYAAKGYFD